MVNTIQAMGLVHTVPSNNLIAPHSYSTWALCMLTYGQHSHFTCHAKFLMPLLADLPVDLETL